MSAFFVSRVTITHQEKFQKYAQLAGKSMQPFGGELIAKGIADAAITGSLEHKVTSIVRFPDIESLRSWAASDAYQSITDLRDESSEI